MDQTGKFAVVWGTAFSPGTDTDSYAIVARRFDADWRLVVAEARNKGGMA